MAPGVARPGDGPAHPPRRRRSGLAAVAAVGPRWPSSRAWAWLALGLVVARRGGAWGAWVIVRQVSAASWVELDEELVIRRGRHLPDPGQHPVRPPPVRRPPQRAAVPGVRHRLGRDPHRLPGERRHHPGPAGWPRPRRCGRGSPPGARRSERVCEPSTPRAGSRPVRVRSWQHLHPLSPLLRGGFRPPRHRLTGSSARGSARSSVPRARRARRAVRRRARARTRSSPTRSSSGSAPSPSSRSSRAGHGSAGGSPGSGSAPGRSSSGRASCFRQHRQVPLERVQAVEISRPLLARVVRAGPGRRPVGRRARRAPDARPTSGSPGLTRCATTSSRWPAAATSAPGAAGRTAYRPRRASPRPGGAAPLTARRRPIARGAAGAGRAQRAALRRDDAPHLHRSSSVRRHRASPRCRGRGRRRRAHRPRPRSSSASAATGSGSCSSTATSPSSEVADSLRIRHGLTDLRTTTIPLHRVQAVEVLQPCGGVRSAGGGSGSTSPGSTARDAGRRARDDGAAGRDLRRRRLRCSGSSTAALRPADPRRGRRGRGASRGLDPRRRRASRMLDPLSWRRNGYAVSDDSVIARRGRLTRRAVVVPHARIQSLTAAARASSSGPWGWRRSRLVSTPGPVLAGAAPSRGRRGGATPRGGGGAGAAWRGEAGRPLANRAPDTVD